MIDIPYVAQGEAGYCAQACVKSTLEYFSIPSPTELKELRSSYGESNSSWTTTAEVACKLDDCGLSVKYCSSGVNDGFTENWDSLPSEVRKQLAEKTNMGAVSYFFKEIGSRGLYLQRENALSEVQNEVRIGNPVITLLNLWHDKEPEAYWGHFVVVKAVGAKYVHAMDPSSSQTYSKMTKEFFEKAFVSPGTFTDMIVAGGLK